MLAWQVLNHDTPAQAANMSLNILSLVTLIECGLLELQLTSRVRSVALFPCFTGLSNIMSCVYLAAADDYFSDKELFETVFRCVKPQATIEILWPVSSVHCIAF